MISVRRYASSLRHSEADLSISYCFISWPCEYPGLSFQRSPVCACSLVSSLLLSGATMSQQPSLTQSAHSVRQVLTAYTLRPPGSHQVGSLPSAAGTQGLYTEDGWLVATARHPDLRR